MGRFLNGVLIGVGIGLVVAPMRGDEMRRLLQERFVELRDNLPERDELMQASQRVATNLSQTANVVKDAAQQAANKVQSTSKDLGGLAQQTAQKVKQGG